MTLVPNHCSFPEKLAASLLFLLLPTSATLGLGVHVEDFEDSASLRDNFS